MLGFTILTVAKKGPDGVNCNDCAKYFDTCYQTPACLQNPSSGCQFRCKKETCEWKETCRMQCRYTECL
ncbi:hypothetical protein J1614_001352 [Plenodomus biglobosus]|nr:hypothetical protein J1614_001352 [Plenodomus biglobosus]